MIQIFLFGLTVWRWEFRDENITEFDLHIAAVSDGFGVGNCLRIGCLPPRNNVFWRRQMQLKIFQAHPLFITQIRTSTNAQQNLMRLLVFVIEVMAIAGHHTRNVQFLADALDVIIDLFLLRPVTARFGMTVILQLHVVAITKD